MEEFNKKVVVPYAVMLIGDPRGTVPEAPEGKLVSSTESCVAVGCRPEADGETELIVRVGDAEDTFERPVFNSILQLPSEQISIRSVTGDQFVIRHMSAVNARVRIWTNHPTEPDRVVICIA